MALKADSIKANDSNTLLALLGDDYSGPLSIVSEYLPLTDVVSLLSTNRASRDLLKDERLWRQLLLRDFGPESIPKDLTLCQIAYKINHEIVKKIIHPSERSTIRGIKCYHLIRVLELAGKYNSAGTIGKISRFLLTPENRVEAERNINLIKKNDRIKSEFLSCISESYMHADKLVDAERIALLIPEALEKSWPLQMIAEVYRKRGNLAEASRLFSELEEVALLIPDHYYKIHFINYIFESYREMHNLIYLIDAERVALLFPQAEDKSEALSVIAKDHRMSGNLEEASRLFSEAERVALLISEAGRKSVVLEDIAEDHRMSGNLEEASRLFSEAEKVALLIPEAGRRSVVLEVIAKRHKNAGNLNGAERVALLIPDPILRERAIEEITPLKPFKPLYQRFTEYVRSFNKKNFLVSVGVVAGVVAIVANKVLLRQ
jgi:tetratricopeptide (TPR) repeat protein